MKKKVIRVSTVPISLDLLLKGQLRFLNNFFDVLAVSSPGDSLETVKEREGVKTKSIKIERKISPIKDLISLIMLYRLFKKEKPDIVHSITPKAGLLSMLAAYFAGCPIRCHTFTGLIFPTKSGLIKTILIAMDKLLCYCATHVYPEGLGVKNDLINYSVTNKPLKIIGNGNVNGVDIEYFDSLNVNVSEETKIECRSNPGEFTFVFVGRLVRDKGINELIKCFDELSKGYKNVKLILVGDFDLDPIDDSTLHLIGNNSRIVHVGFKKDIRPYLKLADVFVFPSYREGFPNVVLQAGAMCLPSIVTNINGSNEIISNLYNGVIIEPRNEKCLKQEMEKMIVGKYNLLEMGRNAKNNIINKFDKKFVWNCLLEEYKSY